MPIIYVLKIFVLFVSSKKTRKLEAHEKMGSELRVSERLAFGGKITSMQIAWLDDSAKNYML